MEAGQARCVDDLDNLRATELRLGLPGTKAGPRANKRPLDREAGTGRQACNPSSETGSAESGQESAPVAKAQVVGWPPIRSYRKISMSLQATKISSSADQAEGTGGLYVKVSMDGAPYLRKIDLKLYVGYRELRDALDAMFTCFSSSSYSSSSSSATDGSGSEFTIAYEDKDGDLMLVGDVPWERLRLMRGSEAHEK